LQSKFVRKLDLEVAIATTLPHPSPKAYLEQYTISPEAAAEILYMATYIYNDIIGKTVIDLGCGTGRLAIAAALLGAEKVVGVDIDRKAITVAVRNTEKLGIRSKVDWIVADIDAIRGQFDTVLENPPFGVQRRRADQKFLERALQVGDHIYSLHKAPKIAGMRKKIRRKALAPAASSFFLERLIERDGGEVKATYAFLMTIPRLFAFHQKRRHQFLVNLYVIERKEQKVY
jgi:putative methylase